MQHGPEIKEHAYRAWLQCGENPDRAAKELARAGTPVGRSTIARWRDTLDWKGRARQERGGKEKAGEGREDFSRLIADLEAQKERYERFFEGLGEGVVDVQATYAYATLIKAIGEVRKRAAQKPNLYAMTALVMDEFVKFILARESRAGTAVSSEVRQGVFRLIDEFFDEVKPE